MCDRYVVDTNVLRVASASKDGSATVIADTTPECPRLRKQVYNWVSGNIAPASKEIILDIGFKIWNEYEKNMSAQDYGYQVLLDKISKRACSFVELRYDRDGNAELEELVHVIHDRSDRKFVAAALKAIELGLSPCPIANASDTDWYDWVEQLTEHGIQVIQILDDWCHAKWIEKKGR